MLEGGIRYVLKYVDKQVHGDMKRQIYTEQGIEAPFNTMSKGLGNDLFFTPENYNLIMTEGNYKNLAGKKRPVPQYWKNMFLAGGGQSTIERKLKEYEKIYQDKTYKNFDTWQNHIMTSRERILQDLELQSGHAILRTGQAIDTGKLRGVMYRENEKIWNTRAETFNKKIMEMIYEHNGELA